MDISKLAALDLELDKLEMSYDISLEQGLDDEDKLIASHFKLRELIKKNNEWRKELLEQLKNQ